MANESPMMNIEECAEMLCMNPQQLRAGIENGSFAFGICIRTQKSKVYKISRTAFMRWYNGDLIEQVKQ